jgi:hypothetical protein
MPDIWLIVVTVALLLGLWALGKLWVFRQLRIDYELSALERQTEPELPDGFSRVSPPPSKSEIRATLQENKRRQAKWHLIMQIVVSVTLLAVGLYVIIQAVPVR